MGDLLLFVLLAVVAFIVFTALVFGLLEGATWAWDWWADVFAGKP